MSKKCNLLHVLQNASTKRLSERDQVLTWRGTTLLWSEVHEPPLNQEAVSILMTRSRRLKELHRLPDDTLFGFHNHQFGCADDQVRDSWTSMSHQLKHLDPMEDENPGRFVNFGCRTHYTHFRGMGVTKDWVMRAQQLGDPCVSVADADVGGFVELTKLTRKYELWPMYGAEFHLLDPTQKDARMILGFALSDRGFRDLCALSTASHVERVILDDEDVVKPIITFDMIKRFRDIAWVVPGPTGYLWPHYLGDLDHACDMMTRLRDLVGQENLYVARVHYRIATGSNKTILMSRPYDQLVDELETRGFQTLASSNPVFPFSNDAVIYPHWLSQHEDRLWIQRLTWSWEQYPVTETQWSTAYRRNFERDVQDRWFETGQQLMERCKGAGSQFGKKTHFPRWRESEIFDPDEPALDIETRFQEVLNLEWEAKLATALNGISPELLQQYEDRISEEYEVLKKKQLFDYFLIVWDICRYAKRAGVPRGPNRGSVGGCLIAYVLDIIEIDPIRYGTMFSRFLNAERSDYPDIDLDFASKVLGGQKTIRNYVIAKYGHRRTAIVGSRITKKMPATIKVAIQMLFVGEKAHRITLEREVAAGLKKFRKFKKKNLAEDITFEELKEFDIQDTEEGSNHHLPMANKNFHGFMAQYPEAWDVIQRLWGHASGYGGHAGGVVIAAEDLDDAILPCIVSGQRDDGKTEEVTKRIVFGKEDLETVGGIKFDILAVQALDFCHHAQEKIRLQDPEFVLADIDVDDPTIYEMFAKGNTVGIFQFSSSSLTKFLRSYRPSCLDHLCFANAAYRPGPLAEKLHIQGSDVKNGHLSIEEAQPNETLRNMLLKTHGVMIYQEQMMSIAHKIGGLSLVEADLFRLAIKKKDAGKMLAFQDRFTKHAVENFNLSEETIHAFFEVCKGFAIYGFNYSHSLGYSLLAAQTCYLKAKHPRIFFESMFDDSSIKPRELMRAIHAEFPDYCLKIKPPCIKQGYYDRAHTSFTHRDDKGRDWYEITLPFWRLGSVGVPVAALFQRISTRLTALESIQDLVDLRREIDTEVRKDRRGREFRLVDQVNPFGPDLVANPLRADALRALATIGALHSLYGLEPIDFNQPEAYQGVNYVLNDLSKRFRFKSEMFVTKEHWIRDGEAKLFGGVSMLHGEGDAIKYKRFHDFCTEKTDEINKSHIARRMDSGEMFFNEMRNGKLFQTIVYVSDIKPQTSNRSDNRYLSCSISNSKFSTTISAFRWSDKQCTSLEAIASKYRGKVASVTLEYQTSPHYSNWCIKEFMTIFNMP